MHVFVTEVTEDEDTFLRIALLFCIAATGDPVQFEESERDVLAAKLAGRFRCDEDPSARRRTDAREFHVVLADLTCHLKIFTAVPKEGDVTKKAIT